MFSYSGLKSPRYKGIGHALKPNLKNLQKPKPAPNEMNNTVFIIATVSYTIFFYLRPACLERISRAKLGVIMAYWLRKSPRPRVKQIL